MIYATVTTLIGTKIQFNVDKFFSCGISEEGKTVITITDGVNQAKIICAESQENIFDNIVEIYGDNHELN